MTITGSCHKAILPTICFEFSVYVIKEFQNVIFPTSHNLKRKIYADITLWSCDSS